MRLTTLVAAVAACLLAHTALGQVIRVPQDIPAIQDAINVAPNGAQIVVAPGTYTANLTINAKVLTIIGEAGAAATTLASAGGRALVLSNNAVVSLQGFTIAPPAANAPSGIISTNCTLTVRECNFVNCRPPGGPTGGAVQITGGTASFAACRFISNTAPSFGGAIQVNSNGVITAHNCLFQQSSSGVAGGAIDLQPGTASIANCLFAHNASTFGGALATVSPGSRMTNCIFAENSITTGIGQAIAYGGPVAADVITITNSIFWGNLGGNTGPIAATSGPATTFAVTYSDVQGGYTGTGNINAEPMFVAVGIPGDYRLQPGSPCIDAGNNAAIPLDVLDVDGDGNVSEPLSIDLAGDPRRADDPTTPDTGAGAAPVVDMGAYEFVGTLPCRVDFDEDGVVNSGDISAFLSAWIQAVSSGCP